MINYLVYVCTIKLLASNLFQDSSLAIGDLKIDCLSKCSAKFVFCLSAMIIILLNQVV